MKSTVIVKFGVPGFHAWKDAPPEVEYLAHEHRHIFTFRISVEVMHDDRDVEFHLLHALCIGVLEHAYESTTRYGVHGLEFGGSSCEMIAKVIITHLLGESYKVDYVEVFEDDECGARVEP